MINFCKHKKNSDELKSQCEFYNPFEARGGLNFIDIIIYGLESLLYLWNY